MIVVYLSQINIFFFFSGVLTVDRLTCVFQLDSDEWFTLPGQVTDVVYLSDSSVASEASKLDHVTYVQVTCHAWSVRPLVRHVERVE